MSALTLHDIAYRVAKHGRITRDEPRQDELEAIIADIRALTIRDAMVRDRKFTTLTTRDRFQLFYDMLDEHVLTSDAESFNVPRHHVEMLRDGFAEALATQDERSPSYDALAIIVNNFCEALRAHGIGDEYDTPTDALDALVAKAKQAPAPTIEQTSVALCVVGDTEHITDEIIANWTDEQRQAAFDWAIAVHYRASDNDDVEVPARPVFTIASAQEIPRG